MAGLHFSVPFTAPGVSLADDWRTLGMRATGSHTVILDKVFVPVEAIVLRRPRGRFHPAWNVIFDGSDAADHVGLYRRGGSRCGYRR